MKRKAVSVVMLTLLLIGMLTLVSNIQPAEAQTREVGVKVGDWAKYEVAYSLTTNDPNYQPQFVDIECFKTEVLSITDANITFQATTYHKNGTETLQVIEMNVSVYDPYHPISAPPFFIEAILFIPANLTVGDWLPLWQHYDGQYRIMATLMRTYAGAEREVNYVYHRIYFYGLALPSLDRIIFERTMHIFWDRATGVLAEGNATTIINNLTKGYVTKTFAQMTMKETNIWSPDLVPPTTSASLSGTTAENGWYKSEVTITLEATDEGQVPQNVYGVAYTNYKIDDGYWTLYSSAFVVSSEGKHKVFFYSVDRVGNSEPEKNIDVWIDQTSPSEPTPDDEVDVWDNDNTPTFTWSAPADTSGIAGFYWKVDDSAETWTTSTSVEVPAQSDGTHTFYVEAKDNAGWLGSWDSHEFKIDTTPPSTTISSPTEGQTITSSNVTVSWAGTDVDGSGIDYYQAKLDSGNWINKATANNHTFTDVSDGNHTVSIMAMDKAGNSQESFRSFSVTRAQAGLKPSDLLWIVGALVIIGAILTAVFIAFQKKAPRPK